MDAEIELGDIVIELIRKDIKNVHLSVHPPYGRVRISAPARMSTHAIRAFALSRLGWIKGKQKKLAQQNREPVREFLELESHYVWGKRYLLQIIERDEVPRVELTARNLVLQVRPGTTKLKLRALLEYWYRRQIREALPALVEKWEKIMQVKVGKLFVQNMKTRWGGCSPNTGNIRINTELARKPREFLEYIIIHEMTHLIAPSHNKRFLALMDLHMPNWRQYRDELNRLPLREEIWS